MGKSANKRRGNISAAGCLPENRLEQFINSSLRLVVCREIVKTTSQKPARCRQTHPSDAQCGN